jgi:GDSL/SGNH-like Acyl-Esterase family found in Pmr5 and Cas1p
MRESLAFQSTPSLRQTSANTRPRPLCKIGQGYTKGSWIRDESIHEYPYLGGEGMWYKVCLTKWVGYLLYTDLHARYKLNLTSASPSLCTDYEWGPRCTEMEKNYLATGAVPDFLKYRWQPESCDLSPFDKDNFCRLLDGLTIGIIGDSMQQQFAHSFIGLMLGKLQDEGFFVPPDYGKLLVELCPDSQYSVSLVFRRWNKYQGTKEDRTILGEMAQLSDYLILNWGVHYQPWSQMENSTQDFIGVLEENWQPPNKKPRRLFWRSTIAAHDNCSASTGPESLGHALHTNPGYNANEIMLQDKQIVQPLLKFSPSLDVTFLRIEKSTLMRSDGHRVVGHGGSEDCLHYCEPGPTDSWVKLFYHHVVMGI